MKKEKEYDWLQGLKSRYVFTRHPQRQHRHSKTYGQWLSSTLRKSNLDKSDQIKIWNHFKKYPHDYIRPLPVGLVQPPDQVISKFLREKRLQNLRQKYPSGIPRIKKGPGRTKKFPRTTQ